MRRGRDSGDWLTTVFLVAYLVLAALELMEFLSTGEWVFLLLLSAAVYAIWAIASESGERRETRPAFPWKARRPAAAVTAANVRFVHHTACPAACAACPEAHNGINGRWCGRVRRYVEHDAKEPCGGGRPEGAATT